METAGVQPRRWPRSEREVPRFDSPNVLWFFGAFAASVATLSLISLVPETHHDVWELLVSLAFFGAYALASWALCRSAWPIPGGLMTAVAVSMMPAIGYGFVSIIRTYPHESFFDPFQSFSGSLFAIALATVVVGFVAFLVTGFSFLFFTVVAAILFTTQFLLPALDSHPSPDAHATTAIVTGAVLVVIGLVLDAAGRRRNAFWFHVGGFFAVAVALIYFATGVEGDVDRGWTPMIVAGGIVLLISAPLWRATWAVYGVLGFYSPLVHWLTNGLKANSTGLTLILLAMALSVFVVGLGLARFARRWGERRRRTAPPAPPPPAPPAP